MERNKFIPSEVIAYLEWKIGNNLETDEEMRVYEDYKWNGKFSRNTYKQLLKEMYKEYRGE
ncbi:hypothetical protein BAOM_3098 [Peribacillus asahii]|uniref:Uncharacterized protein n=1 Tax=Peribacillus asahii TaxID=228899 RepID=A0A3T0KTG0_9BACI|nr:hypothetical protein [Peribacillus asahii]AZV43707.1 hypothetical protein BAOM_3098 [Peribacillus asahii]